MRRKFILTTFLLLMLALVMVVPVIASPPDTAYVHFGTANTRRSIGSKYAMGSVS